MMPESATGGHGKERPGEGADQHEDVSRLAEPACSKLAQLPMRDDEQHSEGGDSHASNVQEAELLAQ